MPRAVLSVLLCEGRRLTMPSARLFPRRLSFDPPRRAATSPQFRVPKKPSRVGSCGQATNRWIPDESRWEMEPVERKS